MPQRSAARRTRRCAGLSRRTRRTAPAGAGRSAWTVAATTTRWLIWSRRGWTAARVGSRPSGCCRLRARPGTPGRRATSVGWSRRRRRCGGGGITAADARRCGLPATRWSSTGAYSRGCTCSARCWPGHGCGSCASPTTNAPARRWGCWPNASRPSAECPRRCSLIGWAV